MAAAPVRDLAAELRSEGPELSIWQPQPGDILQGRLVAYRERLTKYGRAMVAVVETDDGDRRGVFLSRVLWSLFETEHPKRDDLLAIAYDGREPTKGYHRYRLKVQRLGDLPPIREETPALAVVATVDPDPEAAGDPDPFAFEEGS